MGERTDNIPPEWQAVVLDAIAKAQERRAELEANGQLKDHNKILKEAYQKLVATLHASGVPEEEFITEHHFYVASGLGRVLSWALAYSKEHPATHRKGYGEEGYEEIVNVDRIIFRFGGGGQGGPGPGPGGPDWPEPETPDIPDDWGWAPDLSKNYEGILADSWNRMDIDRLQQDALRYGGKDAVTNLHGVWLLQAARELKAMGEPIGMEYYHNPIPGPPIPDSGELGNNFSPDILLVFDQDHLYSVDVIAGTDRTWTQGRPSWQVSPSVDHPAFYRDWRDVPE